MDSYIEIDIIIKDTHGGSSLGSKQSQPTEENGRQRYILQSYRTYGREKVREEERKASDRNVLNFSRQLYILLSSPLLSAS